MLYSEVSLKSIYTINRYWIMGKYTKKTAASKHLKKAKTDNEIDAKDRKAIVTDKKQRKKKVSKKAESEADDSSSEEEDAADMEANMKALAKDDPEFYQYLEENDKDLLDFTSTNPLDAISDDDDENASANEEAEGGDAADNKESEAEEDDEQEKVVEKVELSIALVKKWKKSLKESPNLKVLRNIISAFKAAANLNNEESIADFKYALTDERAFNELMFVALKDLPVAIQKMNPYVETKGSRTLKNDKFSKKISSLLRSHSASMLILLNDINNTETAALVLNSVNQLLPYFLSYRRTMKNIVKSIANIWATTRDVQTQIATFAFLFSAAKEYKKSLLEMILKNVYSTFIKFSSRTNIRTSPLINFQKNSASELFNINPALSYQICFENIRQLAISLRNSMNSITKKKHGHNQNDAYKLIYSWQFCHALDFWSRVLSFSYTSNGSNPLNELIYPLVQITIGTIRLNPTAQYFPLRFYLIRSLIRISQNTKLVIPIFSLLSEMLISTSFTKVPKKSKNVGNLIAFDFDHNIKCTQGYLGTKVYQDGLFEQFIDLLGEYFGLYAKDIAFPEFVTPAVINLRRFIKTSKNIKLNKQLMNIVEKLNDNSKFICEKRLEADFTPRNISEVNSFLKELSWDQTPLGSFVVVQREIREEKAKILRESIEEDDKESQEAQLKKDAALLGVDLNKEESDEDVEMSD